MSLEVHRYFRVARERKRKKENTTVLGHQTGARKYRRNQAAAVRLRLGEKKRGASVKKTGSVEPWGTSGAGGHKRRILHVWLLSERRRPFCNFQDVASSENVIRARLYRWIASGSLLRYREQTEQRLRWSLLCVTPTIFAYRIQFFDNFEGKIRNSSVSIIYHNHKHMNMFLRWKNKLLICMNLKVAFNVAFNVALNHADNVRRVYEWLALAEVIIRWYKIPLFVRVSHFRVFLHLPCLPAFVGGCKPPLRLSYCPTINYLKFK